MKHTDTRLVLKATSVYMKTLGANNKVFGITIFTFIFVRATRLGQLGLLFEQPKTGGADI